jgi:PERQ amino acid-rich with GYF domain-containing protein
VDELYTLISSGVPSDMIAETVHANSTVMNGARFAEDFLRRKKLADKGVIEPSSSGTSYASAGESASDWSRVAKKGPPKEDPTAGFKVVPNKKKGKK